MANKISGRATRRKAAPQPAGKSPARPGRAKKTLGDDFLAAVRADFRSHGAGVLAAVRADKPEQYLKIVLSVLPRDFNAAINGMDMLSDDEIRSRIRALEGTLGPGLGAPDEGADLSGAAPGTGAETGEEQAG